jgi:CYTH domain-containing protein
MQELEIEKRFLVPTDKIDTLKKSIIPDSMTKMKDIYVPNGPAHKDLRLRQKGDKFMITRKRPVKNGDTTTMLETTIELSEDEFNAMSQGIETSVEKERYLVDVSEWRGELDIFQGRHAGLVVVEFEFQNDADLADFEANAKLDLLDITNIEWLAGGRLAEINSQNLKEKIQFKAST